MEKQKRWQLFVIVAVILLTIYNILPTIFFYTKPLKEPIGAEAAQQISLQTAERVNDLETEAVEWIKAFSNNLEIKPTDVQFSPVDPRFIIVSFANSRDQALFTRFLPRAGSLITFVPSQLELGASSLAGPNQVVVQRQLGTHFPKDNLSEFFTFTNKFDNSGKPTSLYQEVVYDRLSPLLIDLAGESKTAKQLQAALADPKDSQAEQVLLSLSRKIIDFERAFGSQSPVAKRFYSSFSQSENPPSILQFIKTLETLSAKLTTTQKGIVEEQKELQSKGKFLDPAKEQTLKLIASNLKTIESAKNILQNNISSFGKTVQPFTNASVAELLAKLPQENKIQTIDLGSRNPFFSSVNLDWTEGELTLVLHPDVQEALAKQGATESSKYMSDKANQLVIDEVAQLARSSGEVIAPANNGFAIALNQLSNSQSILMLQLGAIASHQAKTLQENIHTVWHPQSADLSSNSFPIWDYNTYQALPAEQKKLGLVIYAPASDKEATIPGFRTNSIYIIAKGLQPLIQQYERYPDSPQAEQFKEDIKSLKDLLQQYGFFSYPATAYGLPSEFKQDYIFELDDFYSPLLKATREQFSVHGSRRFAVLEFTDVEQRIIARNRIEDSIHEDLLKWKDAYHAAQVDLNLAAHYDVPPPSKNAYWDNFKLSFKKYFRGDDRKILRWGLDLSGGKTVRIGLKDHNNKPVTDPADLTEGVNELYKRVNKMGVSEVGIRIEGNNIVLDFPGSQGLSATDLIKASSMTFHVVNEKFTPNNAALGNSVNQFLQEVWNEAVVTNRKDIENINLIAWQHLGGSENDLQDAIPQSDAAQVLYENGLRLPNPKDNVISSNFDDTTSAIAVLRGSEFSEWQGQSHPLLITFNNFALEGANLQNVQVGYDPSKGNILSFDISGSGIGSDGQKIDPRDDFYNWTSQFSQEKIAGTPKESYSRGSGWRMAVILNGSVISWPTLNNPLRDHAMITGHFSQREINQLAADLKAGSLSFTPQILSEQNVSPELGLNERTKGISAAAIGILLIIIVMILYYRFAGVVASIAVLINLLIMWGVLQNLDAALTLPSIAGIILTVAMALDANILVYERFKEEFAISKRLPSAMQAGYRKAFSAIIDSNLTTIIAAIILLQFDSGPIKSFAVTLIVGIISSMFTALFLTRYFFAGWVQNPKHKTLKMANLLNKTHFNFLSKTKIAAIISAVILIAGGYFLYMQRHTILGMEFTGGYALTVNLDDKQQVDYRAATAQALLDHGANSSDFQIRELNTPNNLRIQLGMTMEQPGHPFYGLPIQYNLAETDYSYEQNPRINWVVNALKDNGLTMSPVVLSQLEQNWSEMSGQLSDTMRNNAIIGIGLALLCILIYITVRFEFNYAISAILGLAYDVLVTLAILAICHALKIPLQIDMQVVAALMTIIGYSLNDTIIIFDRIREDVRLMRKVKFADIVNHALNATLSRTMMTSGTTLLVLLALVFLGGNTIFSFAFVMTIGVIVGTLSSLFIAAPLMVYFHERELTKEKKQSPPLSRVRVENQ